MRRLLVGAMMTGLLVLTYFVFLSGPVGSAPGVNEGNVEQSAEANSGRDLRSEIAKQYEELRKSGELRINQQGNDITDIVRRYIDVGTSFDEAEKILRNASFKVLARPGRNAISDRPDRYNVYASSEEIIRSNVFGYGVNVAVLLRPESPDDYSKITFLFAYIGAQAL